MQKTFFTEKQASISAALGGPLAAGILIYLNYARLGKEKEALTTLCLTSLFTVLLVGGLMIMPEHISEKIPDIVFTSTYAVLVYVFFRHFMTDDINKEFESGGETASNWSVAGFTIASSVVTLAFVFGLATVQPPFPGNKISFGENAIYHGELIKKEQAEMLANQLFKIEYFNSENPGVAHLEKLPLNYIVTIPVDKQFWSDAEIVSLLTSMKWLLEVDLGAPTELILEHYSLSGKTERKTL